jgi:phosphoadenosine phosphosulfate reductase
MYLSANRKYIDDKIFEAEQYILNIKHEYEADPNHKYIPTISFSGGKDSTVVSRLVRDALQTENIIHYFGDTTLEFSETYDYVNNTFRQENPIPPMLSGETDNDFFKLCTVFGPPSRFERWCCTIFKTSNLNAEYRNLVGNSLSFLGIRRSESNERKGYARTQKQSKIGSQVNGMPIIDWTDYDVWLYILYKDLRFNHAYRFGYKRVGCWCCPNNSEWSTMLTEIYYPEYSAKWKTLLYRFAEKTGKNDIEDYVENGKWRARKGASGLTTRNVSIVDTPCNLADRARNIIIKKNITPDILEFLKPFGKLDAFEKEDATYISISEKNGNANACGNKKICDIVITWGTPVVKILPAKGVDALLLINRIKCQLRKYQFCICCTACDSICPYGAVNTMSNGRYLINESKCKQNLTLCSKCIAKFYNGCITCQVLAGKKNIQNDTVEM